MSEISNDLEKKEGIDTSTPKVETFDLKSTIDNHLQTIKPLPAKEENVGSEATTTTTTEAGKIDNQVKVEEAHPYDKIEEKVIDDKNKTPEDDGKAFGSKIKAFLKNGEMFVGMMSGFTEIVLNSVLIWAYKKQVDPDDEISQLPEVKTEAKAIEQIVITEENKATVQAQKSALLLRIESIEQKVDKFQKYSADIQFSENEKEVLKAVFEHKFSGTQLAEYVDKYPMAAVVIGIVLPRVFPVGQEAFKKYTS